MTQAMKWEGSAAIAAQCNLHTVVGILPGVNGRKACKDCIRNSLMNLFLLRWTEPAQ